MWLPEVESASFVCVAQSTKWVFSSLGSLLCWRRKHCWFFVGFFFFPGICGSQIPPLVASWNPREQINTSTPFYPPCNLSPSSLTFVFSFALGLVAWQRGERMPLALHTCRSGRQSPNCDWDTHGDAVVKNKRRLVLYTYVSRVYDAHVCNTRCNEL